ncbi:unnamed protein product [Trifolium pratense]|uniref:Uncharacterized protein n=1 Tax=Trifolium pratense TaxID=57577 RepID=A0ACB0KS11_TRIPR|nr:unnamed protein product [Trifolium pratense]
MLERFGVIRFMIKLKDSFKSGNSGCFVLKHVEHERPEFSNKTHNESMTYPVIQLLEVA